jgi:cyclophilin family peptidyl-prolyl cis-trans isomerase
VPETRAAVAATFVEALAVALKDEEPDAALAILAALNQLAAPTANAAIESALTADDYLVRRRAATLLDARALKSSGGNSSPGSGGNENSFAARVSPLTSQYTDADYARAVARSKKRVQAVVTTDKGAFTIELLPEAAPLTVDNFVTLATKGFFNNVSVHRVVPNFVMQTGDPRGDGNGGPGYQIRCEINTVPYTRGAIGMALSGKDTGGSQWFVTHSPQPHLDGGYTVFGQVTSGMETVDAIVRGDRIRDVRVTETAVILPRRSTPPARKKGAR